MKKYLLPILSALFISGFIFAASTFPTSLDSLPTVSTGDVISADAWNNKVGAINNLETKVGIDSSADTSSLDYKINNIVYKWELYNSSTLRPTSTTIGIIVSASSTFSGTISSDGGFIGNLTGKADTATALAANPTDCTANKYAISIDASGNLTCDTVTAAGDGSSNWQFIGVNAIRPTSTVGIIVQASSTIGARLNMESNAVFNASTTFKATTTFDIMPVLPEDYILNKLFEPATTTFSVAANTTTTLDRDVYYTSTTIAVGGTLRTNGYRLFVSGELVNNGNIENNGSNGTSSDPSSNAVSNASTTGTMRGGNVGATGRAGKSGAGGPGGGIVFIVADTLTNNGVIEANGGKGKAAVLGGVDGAGNVAAPCLACKGGNGGKGGNSEAQVGGAGSVITQDKQDFRDIFRAMDMWSASNATGTGAGGGGGGGAESITGNNSSGGGGGGGGGFVTLFYNTFNDNGTEQAEGGPGGAGFATGDTGTTGSVGIIIKVDLND